MFEIGCEILIGANEHPDTAARSAFLTLLFPSSLLQPVLRGLEILEPKGKIAKFTEFTGFRSPTPVLSGDCVP